MHSKKEGIITLEGMEFYAHHGVGEVEREIGRRYWVDLYMGYDVAQAMESDNVAHTLDYVDAYTIVAEEMAKPCRLLEHLGQNIGQRLRQKFPELGSLRIKVGKKEPFVGGPCAQSYVELQL